MDLERSAEVSLAPGALPNGVKVATVSGAAGWMVSKSAAAAASVARTGRGGVDSP